MSRARRRALLAALLLAAVAAAFVYANTLRRDLGPRPPDQRPTLLLLTSLPIVFPDNFSIDAPASPALQALETRYDVVPISVTDPGELAKGRLLLMAQPRAQPAEDLVALDAWVRDGGHLLLLADPMLEWPSDRPLGDPLRPPPMFADTGLLGHWGLRLDAPDRRGAAARQLGGERIATVSPGSLAGGCRIAKDWLVAHCRIGKGQATIVADADFLDVSETSRRSPNLEALLRALQALERQ